jgi:hypothetical protein
MNIEKAKTSNGIGGIVGYTDNTEINSCYAVGSIDNSGTKCRRNYR